MYTAFKPDYVIALIVTILSLLFKKVSVDNLVELGIKITYNDLGLTP